MTASTEAMARLTESVGDRLVLFQVNFGAGPGALLQCLLLP